MNSRENPCIECDNCMAVGKNELLVGWNDFNRRGLRGI